VSAKVSGSSIPDLKHFAARPGTDKDAVQAGLTLPWSNGHTEAQIGRLKLLKRPMFGRAGFA